MFGEANAIDALAVELVRVIRDSAALDMVRAIRESAQLMATTVDKCRTDVIKVVSDSAASHDEHLLHLAQSIDRINHTLRRFFPPPTPGLLKFVVTGELDMANMLGFKITLPTLPPEPNDVVSGELTVQIGEADPQVVTTTKEQTEILDLAGEQGAAVSVSFVYIDDAGNRSTDASTLTIVLADTIPPATPGALAVEVTSEFVTEDPIPEPTPEEPTPEEPTPEEPPA